MIDLKLLVSQELANFSIKIGMLETEYTSKANFENSIKLTETRIAQYRSELPDDILAYYDKLRVMNKLKGPH